jgi:hypothetical protein
LVAFCVTEDVDDQSVLLLSKLLRKTMLSDEPVPRYQWSKLTSMQIGRYAEHLGTMRFIEAGLEVYSTEVDDRGIDHLVRYAPGRCLELQVKAVRNRNLTFVLKKHLGATPEEVEHRLPPMRIMRAEWFFDL